MTKQPESHTALYDACQEILRLEQVNTELLEALKETVDLNYRSPSCQTGIANPCKCRDCINNRVQAAIAKATGEQA